ncbi:b7eca0d6-6621-40b2-bb1f-88aa882c7961 [Sclerotinia trifoliorum]|uniref:B7eca0d6-6621-40b2-bb1f-88aa882c7961 n=1 Tax=Sclerotinia trifoliorum TaxID=28548 RepID=A0A8H2VVS2_9HELO|nr:b7eca0d6-6621-40b2-bb1f-88aa882c7961 [Sclerotinia trifoliorum]
MNQPTDLQFAPEHQNFDSKNAYMWNNGEVEDQAENIKAKPTPLPCRRTFRRPRAGRACGTCHSRRVRCDAGSRGIPCTNCEAFSLDCSIPPRKKNSSRQGTSDSGRKRSALSIAKQPGHQSDNGDDKCDGKRDGNMELPQPVASNDNDFASLILRADEHIKQQPDSTEQYFKLISPSVSSSAIENPGKVAYLQEKSSLAILMRDYYGTTNAVHYPLPEVAANQHMATKMTAEEMDILEKRGALQLPPRDLCEELIEAYFKWVAPVIPVINKSWFMQRWHDLDNPPPLLLMQAVLLAGSRVCTTSMLLDANDSPIPAATIFYKRAKALYDADYEEDRVVIVQALIHLGWYWEEPGVVTKNVFYWNGLATTIAQGFGMHRSPSGSRLSPADKRLWKRIWWTLYIRDQSVATALGRPAHINMEDSDLEMIGEEDFADDHTEPEDEILVQFFLQYVKICEIMDEILFQHYSLQSRKRGNDPVILQNCDQALNEWLHNCPTQIRWNPSNNNSFWSSYLYLIYHTTRCLLYRAYLPSVKSSSELQEKLDISSHAAFQSARAITSIVENMIARNELRHAPPFLIYSLLSALIIHIYELQIHSSSEKTEARKRVSICMSALEKLSDIWLVAKMVQGLFESILKAAGFENFKVPAGFVENPLHKSKSIGESKENRLPLTHSLLAHQKATLGFVSGTRTGSSNKSQKLDSNNNGISSTNVPSAPQPQAKHQSAPSMHHENEFYIPDTICPTGATPTSIHQTVQYQDPTFPGSINYMLNGPMATWIQPDFQQMIPNTLDVADWFDYFGMR